METDSSAQIKGLFQLLGRAHPSRMAVLIMWTFIKELSKVGLGLEGMVPGYREKDHVNPGLRVAGR